MNRSLIFDMATAAWVGQRQDSLLLGPPGSGKSHIAQAIGHAVIQQGYRVLYREAHLLLEELADATLDGKRKEHMDLLATVPLLIIDDLGMRKLPLIAAEELLEIIMRRYERASTMITSNRPVEDWGKLLGDSAAVTAMLDRLLHHGHVLKCGPRSWRTKTGSNGMLNDKEQSNKDAGQRAPGGVATCDPEASNTKPHPRNLAKNTKPSTDQLIKTNRRGSRNTDSFGASPVSSALDHFTGRDPGKANTTIACQSGRCATQTHRHSSPHLADIGRRGVKQSSLNLLKWPVLH